MVLDLASALWYSCFEFSILMISFRCTYELQQREPLSITKTAIFLISLNLIFTAIFSTVFSFLKINDGLNFLLISVIIAIIFNFAFKKSEFKKYQNYLSELFFAFFNKIINWKIILGFSLILPILISVIRPIDETDSLFHMNKILIWLFNQGTPYTITDHYVEFWNLVYLPSLSITNSDLFLWFNSLKAVMIIGLSSYLVGRTLGIPKYLNGLIVFSGVLFFHFWQFFPAGIPTIKNDIIVATGVILVAYYILKKAKNEQRFSDYILLLIGAIFLIIKSSGVFYLIFAILIIIFIYKGKPVKIKKTALIGIAVGALVLLVTSGHYYLNNFVEFGNPFYPIKLSMFGVDIFKAPTDTSNTSILSSLNEQKVWGFLFFPSEPKAGLLFPGMLAIGLFGTIATIGYTIFAKIKLGKSEKYLFALSLFILGSWLLYFATSWSASHNPDDLFYVSTLASLRYIVGGIIITELFFVYLLYRLGVPEKIILIPIIIQVVSKFYYLYSKLPLYTDYSVLIYPIIISVILLVIKKKIKVWQPKLVATFIVGISFFIFSPMLVEDNRIGWLPWWKETISEIYPLDSSNVLLITEEGNFDYWDSKYPLSGNKFQHKIVTMTETEFRNKIELNEMKNNMIWEKPDFIAKLCNPNVECESELEEFVSWLSKYNYTTNVLEKRAVLLQPSE